MYQDEFTGKLYRTKADFEKMVDEKEKAYNLEEKGIEERS